MKTTLSATCMAFWRNARNWEKGGLPTAQSQRPSALRKSLPFSISNQCAPLGSARRKAPLPELGSTEAQGSDATSSSNPGRTSERTLPSVLAQQSNR